MNYNYIISFDLSLCILCETYMQCSLRFCTKEDILGTSALADRKGSEQSFFFFKLGWDGKADSLI